MARRTAIRPALAGRGLLSRPSR